MTKTHTTSGKAEGLKKELLSVYMTLICGYNNPLLVPYNNDLQGDKKIYHISLTNICGGHLIFLSLITLPFSGDPFLDSFYLPVLIFPSFLPPVASNWENYGPVVQYLPLGQGQL